MGIIMCPQPDVPSLHYYTPEFNKDGAEKHINCDGARFHVLHWDNKGSHCSVKNCEINQ